MWLKKEILLTKFLLCWYITIPLQYLKNFFHINVKCQIAYIYLRDDILAHFIKHSNFEALAFLESNNNNNKLIDIAIKLKSHNVFNKYIGKYIDKYISNTSAYDNNNIIRIIDYSISYNNIYVFKKLLDYDNIDLLLLKGRCICYIDGIAITATSFYIDALIESSKCNVIFLEILNSKIYKINKLNGIVRKKYKREPMLVKIDKQIKFEFNKIITTQNQKVVNHNKFMKHHKIISKYNKKIVNNCCKHKNNHRK